MVGETSPWFQRTEAFMDLLGSLPPWLKFTGLDCNLDVKLENPGERLL